MDGSGRRGTSGTVASDSGHPGALGDGVRGVGLRHRAARGPVRGAGRAGPGLFEYTLVTLMEQAFCWLVIAEPCAYQALRDELTDLRYELQVQRRGEDGLAVERLERRLAELDAFGEAGLWNVRVLAGA